MSDVAIRYEPVIGLEVHVQLATRTKMFCRCEARFGAPPNTLICPVCSGQPGTLPAFNGRALDLGITAGLALGCALDHEVKFDRKNYFYPDLPKGYQVSQFDRPLCHDGSFTFDRADGTTKTVTIIRAHLEEDSGKIIHPEGMELSLVDLNRAGTPLLEIVTAPDLRSSAEARDFLQDLRQTLRYAGVSDCDMEKGSFRCDVNLSLRPVGQEAFGTRTETKNLNSFRFVEQALEAEILRQTAILEAGDDIVQCTLTFDPERQVTRPTRVKEELHDYRYFPEPDLPLFAVAPERVEARRRKMPEAPVARQQRYRNALGLKAEVAEDLIADRDISDTFEATLACLVAADDTEASPAATASWVLNDLRRIANERHLKLTELAVTPQRLGALIAFVNAGKVSRQAARTTILDALQDDPEATPASVAAEHDLLQVSDTASLGTIIDEVLIAEADMVQRYRAGKTGLLNALLGSVMKASAGKANPNEVRKLLGEKLGPPAA